MRSRRRLASSDAWKYNQFSPTLLTPKMRLYFAHPVAVLTSNAHGWKVEALDCPRRASEPT